jgi:hypothetical protein
MKNSGCLLAAGRFARRVAGAALIEVVIVLAIIVVIVTAVIGALTTTTLTYSMAGNWVANPCIKGGAAAFVGKAQVPAQYSATITEVLTTVGPGFRTVTKTPVPPLTAGATVTFSLVGAGGAVLITGGRTYTQGLNSSGSADVKLNAISKAGDVLQATINYDGRSAIDSVICQFETDPTH